MPASTWPPSLAARGGDEPSGWHWVEPSASGGAACLHGRLAHAALAARCRRRLAGHGNPTHPAGAASASHRLPCAEMGWLHVSKIGDGDESDLSDLEDDQLVRLCSACMRFPAALRAV